LKGQKLTAALRAGQVESDEREDMLEGDNGLENKARHESRC